MLLRLLRLPLPLLLRSVELLAFARGLLPHDRRRMQGRLPRQEALLVIMHLLHLTHRRAWVYEANRQLTLPPLQALAFFACLRQSQELRIIKLRFPPLQQRHAPQELSLAQAPHFAPDAAVPRCGMPRLQARRRQHGREVRLLQYNPSFLPAPIPRAAGS